MSALRFTLALLAAPVLFGQNASRTFHLTTVLYPAGLNEIATILRTVGGIRQIAGDPAKFNITVTGSEQDLALAAWLVEQLDSTHPEPAEFAIPGSNDVVNILYAANTPTQTGLNELVTSIRAVIDVPRIFTYSQPHGIVMRMTASKAPLAQWLVHQLDVAADDQNRWQPHQYSLPGTPDQEVKVVYLIHQGQPANLNEMVSTIRTVCDIQAIFTRSQPQGIAFRSTVAQAQLADWLFQQLDAEPDNQMRAQSHEYVLPGTADGVTRVYYLNTADLRDIIVALRSELSEEHPRMFTCTQHKAVAVRGTPDMMAVADRVIKQHDTPVAQ